MLEAIDERLREYCSPTLLLLVNRCNWDLSSGPLYLSKEGRMVSMFDGEEYDHPFDFNRACGILNDALDRRLPSALWYECWSGCVTDIDPSTQCDHCDCEVESDCEYVPGDYYYVDHSELKALITGRILSTYL